MKKMLFLISTVCSLLWGSVVMAETNIGIANLDEIFMKSPEYKETQADFKKKFKGREEEIAKTHKKFQESLEAFSKNSPTMKPEMQKEEQQKILEQQKKLQDLQTKFQVDIKTAQTDAMKKILGKIEEVIKKIADEKKLDLVMAKSSVAYNKKELEITDEVIKRMKK